MSTPPKRLTATSTTFSQFAAELGRMLIASTLAPSARHSVATWLSASSPPAASTRLQPAPASTLEASAPKAPEAPVTIAVLPRMSKSERGFLRKSSDMIERPVGWGHARPCAGHPRLTQQSRAWMAGASPAMTPSVLLHRRDRHRNRADLVAAVDDLAALVRSDVAAVARTHDRLLATNNDSELARQHIVDLLRRRGVGAGAAAREEV